MNIKQNYSGQIMLNIKKSTEVKTTTWLNYSATMTNLGGYFKHKTFKRTPNVRSLNMSQPYLS